MKGIGLLMQCPSWRERLTDEDYRREVELISYERRRKALLSLYEERERERGVNERIIEVTKERVTEILSSPSSPLYEGDFSLSSVISYFFSEYFPENYPDSSLSSFKSYMESVKRFLKVVEGAEGIGKEEGEEVRETIAHALKDIFDEKLS
mgnify:FL=1